jgi:hypothetical protein
MARGGALSAENSLTLRAGGVSAGRKGGGGSVSGNCKAQIQYSHHSGVASAIQFPIPGKATAALPSVRDNHNQYYWYSKGYPTSAINIVKCKKGSVYTQLWAWSGLWVGAAVGRGCKVKSATASSRPALTNPAVGPTQTRPSGRRPHRLIVSCHHHCQGKTDSKHRPEA